MKKIKLIAVIFCALLLILLIIWTAWGNTALTVSEYKVLSDRIPAAFSGFRIAQISDLHNAQFGPDNQELIELLKGTYPDIIVLTGDLIDSRKTDTDTALSFARQAVSIAPCYYVPGNHEARISQYPEFVDRLKACGVQVLSSKQVTLTRGNARIALLGIEDPSFYDDYLFGDTASVTQRLLQDISRDEDLYTVLLAHRPELFDVYAGQNIDLVFSGHAHGGQFRLPFAGGLFAPNQGLFPQYDAGLFAQGRTQMIVSRGIGNSIIPFRFNNRPEIVIAQLENPQ